MANKIRLSKPITEIKPRYQVVVIGSGYGGSIAASRMARAGMSVCLLEKGKEFQPGDYPDTVGKAAPEMQVSYKDKHIGPENGLYEFYVGEEISVFKGCGLGGTSLVNANVSIEPVDKVFEDPRWPAPYFKNKAELAPWYDLARKMLGANPYPENQNGYAVLNKTQAQRKSAEALKEPFALLDINVSFETRVNEWGVEQVKCNNCGDCVTGCNHKAKNTLIMNYLPDAVNHGAEIYCETGVKFIERGTDEWIVHFDLFNTGREKFEVPAMFVRADVVIVSAGSLGSTEVMLHSQRHGLQVSPMLGKHFTGNGDVLGFSYNSDVLINGIGVGPHARDLAYPHPGPCITAVVDARNKTEWKDGMVIEEGVIPGTLKPLLKPAFLSLGMFGKDTDRGWGDWLREKGRAIKSFFLGPYSGALANTQTYLVMTHDDSNGEMKLDGERVAIKWPDLGKQKIFEKVNANLLASTKALGGRFLKNPSWSKLMNYDLVTVHPLGGCAMGADATQGVTNAIGQVYSDAQGTAVHPGLYVMDGAIVPRSLGTNPLLTISALAERNIVEIAKSMGKTVTYNPPTKVGLFEPAFDKTGVQFTEKMTGYVSLSVKDDYQRGHDVGKEDGSSFYFVLTIQTHDVDRFIADPAHEAGMTGSVVAPALSPSPLTVTEGWFNLFVADPANPKNKKMKYRMVLNAEDGKQWYFDGFKDVKDDKGFDMWRDTTVLFITVSEGNVPGGAVLGKGMLKIEVKDFKNQIQNMHAIHPVQKGEGLKAVAKFGKFFAGQLWETYV